MSADVLDPYGLSEIEGLKRLSPSALSTADICLMRLGYDRDPNIPRGRSEPSMVGTAYHAGLEGYYGARITSGDHDLLDPLDYVLDDAKRVWLKETDGFTAWDTSAVEAWAKVEKMLVEYFGGSHQWPDSYTVVAVEQAYFVPLHGDWGSKGVIDLVLNDEQGRTVLVDHKTAGRKWPRDKEHPRKNVQSVMYPWSWWRTTGELPFAVVFDVMTYSGSFDRRWSFATPAHMTALLGKAISITTILDTMPADQLPANPSSNLCSEKWCDHWDRCAFGAAAA